MQLLFVLEMHDTQNSHKAVVAYSKHLCGAATGKYLYLSSPPPLISQQVVSVLFINLFSSSLSSSCYTITPLAM